MPAMSQIMIFNHLSNRINPSSPANLDYGRSNDDSHHNNNEEGSSSTNQKSYIDRSDSRKRKDKSIEMRKARIRDKRKKKKISERNTKKFNEDQNND